MSGVEIIAFYKFIELRDLELLQAHFQQSCEAQNIKGTILLAHEGINGTISGTPEAIAAIVLNMRSDNRFSDMMFKHSLANFQPFLRLKVRIKPNIVHLDRDVDPTQLVGTYVKPQDWNALISDPEVMVIDTRNDYEYRVGTFEGAINPGTRAFSDFPDYVATQLDPRAHKKVAMFCTGGVRCEKSTSYLLQQGFEQVFHLDGGILRYLEEIPVSESLWQGECFVFDERVTVKHDLSPGSYILCGNCGALVSEAQRQSPYYEEGVSCDQCFE